LDRHFGLTKTTGTVPYDVTQFLVNKSRTPVFNPIHHTDDCRSSWRNQARHAASHGVTQTALTAGVDNIFVGRGLTKRDPSSTALLPPSVSG